MMDERGRGVDKMLVCVFFSYHRITARVASIKILKQHLGCTRPSDVLSDIKTKTKTDTEEASLLTLSISYYISQLLLYLHSLS